jgi:hypothetical protein
MSELTYRSFFIPHSGRTVGPWGPEAVYAGDAAVLSTFDLEWYYEAIVRDPSRGRLKVTDEDLKVPVRELLVEIDKRLLQRLQRWKSFQHYIRQYDSPTSERSVSDVSIPILRAEHGVFTDVVAPIVSYREMLVDGFFDPLSNPTFGLEEWFDSVSNDGNYVLEPDGLDELIPRSLASLVPKVKTKVQLLNTLYELKDFVTLRSTIRRIRSLRTALSNRGTVGSLRDVAGAAADVFLQLQFNIEPLIRDIQGIHKALVDSLGRLRRLMQFDGVPQVTKYKRDLRAGEGYSIKTDSAAVRYLIDPTSSVVFEPPALISGWVKDPYPTAEVVRSVTVTQELFCAQLRFIARWTETQHRYAEQLGLIDALGLSFNPKHVWDALPWSFVVDWVVKVGDFLDQFSTGALDPVLDILDYSWSISRKREIVMSARVKRFDKNDPAHLIEDKTVIYPTFRESAYSRQPVDLGRNALIASGLSPKELSLAAALILSRRRKLRKPKHTGRGPKVPKRKLKSAKQFTRHK